MDDVKDKVKGLMKKVNNPFSSSSSSSSGRFKGQGRVLGSSSSSSSSSSTPTTSQSHSHDPPQQQQPRTQPVTSTTTRDLPQISNINITQKETTPPIPTTNQHLSQCVHTFLSSSSPSSGEVVVKLFTNIVKEPENPKFRRIRLSNPKIREAVVEVNGGVELLECVGFMLHEENGEMWAVIADVPSEEQICLIKEAVGLLERGKNGFSLPLGFSITRKPEVQEEESLVGGGNVMPMVDAEPELPQKIDRQVRVFFSVPESMTAKIDLPESSYSLSATELKREADARKRQIAESQLLIPKSYKEKKAKDAKKKYKSTVIRIQFPDEVVLQGVFLPWEPTTALYEFVSSSLKDPCLEFELWQPAFPKTRVIPRFPGPRERPPTLEGEDLVPAALIKFKPIETDSAVFTGLSNELLESSDATQK